MFLPCLLYCFVLKRFKLQDCYRLIEDDFNSVPRRFLVFLQFQTDSVLQNVNIIQVIHFAMQFRKSLC